MKKESALFNVDKEALVVWLSDSITYVSLSENICPMRYTFYIKFTVKLPNIQERIYNDTHFNLLFTFGF